VKLTQLLIYGGIAYVAFVYVLPQLKNSGLFNSITGSSGGNANGISASVPGGTSAKVDGSHATVCTGGNCQTFTGDDIAVSCVDGVCHSNNARIINWGY
jgi:hypothetical protein